MFLRCTVHGRHELVSLAHHLTLRRAEIQTSLSKELFATISHFSWFVQRARSICIQVEAICCTRPNHWSDTTACRRLPVSLCCLLQAEILVPAHHSRLYTNAIWITASEELLIRNTLSGSSLPCFTCQDCLLSRCLRFVFLSRSNGRPTELKRGAPEFFRPDVAYNLLHTFFYGLLAFSTMRWT